jgi:hypothetical protein
LGRGSRLPQLRDPSLELGDLVSKASAIGIRCRLRIKGSIALLLHGDERALQEGRLIVALLIIWNLFPR